jgi:hypothetical protein
MVTRHEGARPSENDSRWDVRAYNRHRVETYDRGLFIDTVNYDLLVREQPSFNPFDSLDSLRITRITPRLIESEIMDIDLMPRYRARSKPMPPPGIIFPVRIKYT